MVQGVYIVFYRTDDGIDGVFAVFTNEEHAKSMVRALGPKSRASGPHVFYPDRPTQSVE